MRPRRKPETDKGGKEVQKKKKTWASPRKMKAQHAGASSDGTDAVAQGGYDSDGNHASQESVASEASIQSTSTTNIPIEKMEKIARFYEGHPMFYDLSDDNCKNNPAKEAALAKFAGEIGLSVSIIKRYFTSMRTDRHKLTKKQPKSGSGAVALTKLQKFKLEAYRFLDSHHKPWTLIETFGKIGGDAAGDDDDDGDGDGEDLFVVPPPESTVAVTSSAAPSTSTAAPKKIKSSAKSKTSQVADILRNFLAKSAQQQQEAEQRVAAARVSCEVSEGQLSGERRAWANWLMSAMGDIPEHRFRQYQAESFQLVMRYVEPQQQQPQPYFQQQPQPFSQQSFQQSQQTFMSPPQHYIPFAAPAPPQHGQQQQFTAQVPSASAPSATTTRDWDISTLGPSPGSTGILSQAFTLADALSSSMSTPQHQRRSSSGLNMDTFDTPPVPPVQTIRKSSEAASQALREIRESTAESPDRRTMPQSDSDAE